MDQIDLKKISYIMLFYAILSYVIAPVIGYKITKTKDGIVYGIVVGSVISVILWEYYGKKQI